ncbi:MAG: ATP-binding cassette domain-containing protein [bacterium]
MKQVVFKNIDFGYVKNSMIFEGLSLNILNDNGTGKIIGLMGDSGCGKSTLLKLILRVLYPQNGKLITNPVIPVCAYLPQEPVLFEHLSTLANARYFAKTKNYRKRFDNNTFEEIKRSLNLKEVLENSSSVSKLSGGQKQRLALLQALSIQPDFLLLDEPTTGLDAEVKLQFLNKLKFLTSKYDLLVIYVTHNKTEAEITTDEIIYMPRRTNGAINQIYHEKTNEFITSPPVLEAINVFKYPTPNIIELNQLRSHLSFNVDEDNAMAFIDEKNIHFSNEGGIAFKVTGSNQVFTNIELIDTKQRLALHTELFKNRNGQKINFVGRIPIYKDGILKRIIDNG